MAAKTETERRAAAIAALRAAGVDVPETFREYRPGDFWSRDVVLDKRTGRRGVVMEVAKRVVRCRMQRGVLDANGNPLWDDIAYRKYIVHIVLERVWRPKRIRNASPKSIEIKEIPRQEVLF